MDATRQAIIGASWIVHAITPCDCPVPDAVGFVARVAAFFAESGGWILRSSQHADLETDRYFMRMDVRADSLALGLDELRRRFAPVARAFDMDWQINDSAIRKRVVILVSRQMHCLYDLLERWQSSELDIEKAVLARGLRHHLEDQVLINGNRTVVLRCC